MNIIFRNYKPLQDFEPIRQFLIANHRFQGKDGNFYPSGWEYMHTHSWAPWNLFPRIGIWENEGEIVAVVNMEFEYGEAFFQLNHHYDFLKPQLLDYAEKNLAKDNDDGTKTLQVCRLNSNDKEMQELLKQRGYAKNDWEEWIGFYDMTKEIPICPLPEGFTMMSLAEENDLSKINRVIWRGFNHEGEPPHDLDSPNVMQSGPRFRPSLNIIIKAPNGDYAVYCGMWFEPSTREAYLEPLCTDPDYRKLGLAKAALYEAMRRTQKMGAVSCVSGGQDFYARVGFVEQYREQDWTKTWRDSVNLFV